MVCLISGTKGGRRPFSSRRLIEHPLHYTGGALDIASMPHLLLAVIPSQGHGISLFFFRDFGERGVPSDGWMLGQVVADPLF